VLSTKMLRRILGAVGPAAAALFLFLAQGCADLPFGHRPESDAAAPGDNAVTKADTSSVGPTAANSGNMTPTAVVAGSSMPESGATIGSLAQTTTMPGGPSDTSADSRKVSSSMMLTGPATVGDSGYPRPTGGAVIPVATTIPLGASGVVNAEINKFIFHSPQERAQYERASARFPDFCNDWQRMLRDRETNNLQHLVWQTRDGAQTSTYTGYGQVESCETKESIEGVPIGKISYEEMVYFITGKNTDEARHAPPKLIHRTHTLEIFSWEKEKWFY
jgi:hypothetical protein